MARERLLVYSNATLKRCLAERVTNTSVRKLSSAITAMADRYDAIVKDELARLDLRHEDWLTILAALDHCWVDGWRVEFLPETVRRCHGAFTDRMVLADRLKRLSYAAQAAIVDAAERYWSFDSADGCDEAVTGFLDTLMQRG